MNSSFGKILDQLFENLPLSTNIFSHFLSQPDDVEKINTNLSEGKFSHNKREQKSRFSHLDAN